MRNVDAVTAVGVLAVVFLALHLPYLPASLEDVDSINFALGVRHYDVAHHQPHPPGYPLFIALGKASRALIAPEAHALAVLGIVAGALGIVAIAALFVRLDEDARVSLAGAALAMATPLYWFTANRPLSDMTGLATAVAVQALILSARTPRALLAAAFLAAFAVGLRSQVFWLTAPLLLWQLAARHSPLDDRRNDAAAGRQLGAAAIAYVTGALAWAVPLVVVSGGPHAYWHAVVDQGTEDLAGIRMLWTTPSVRELADALYYAFIAPWAIWPYAAIVLALAAAGVVSLWRRRRSALIAIAVAFGPYLLFDIVFQETFTSRYALPLVVPIAFLSASGARLLPRPGGTAVAVALAMFGAHAGGTSLAAYSRQPAPAFRLLADMARAAPSLPQLPVLAMDRREALDLLRPASWLGDSMPKSAAQLPSPPQHEWLEPVKYWIGGGRAPVWFVADPKRTDIDLIQHGEPQRYRWALPYPVLIDGARPGEMDWYALDAPEWWVGDGWPLTPEAAGVTDADHRGLAYGAIHGWIRSDAAAGGAIVVGGRNFEPTVRRVTLTAGADWTQTLTVKPGFFLGAWRLPAAGADLPARAPVPVTVATDVPARVAIEQFDASSARPVFGFGDGWNEQEYNPESGLRWRWLSEHGDLRVMWSGGTPGAILRIEGESPRRYFPRGSKLTIRADGRAIFDAVLSSDFSLHVPISRPAESIAFEVDQFYVPAERTRRSRDRRHLALRIFRCEMAPVSAPGR